MKRFVKILSCVMAMVLFSSFLAPNDVNAGGFVDASGETAEIKASDINDKFLNSFDLSERRRSKKLDSNFVKKSYVKRLVKKSKALTDGCKRDEDKLEVVYNYICSKYAVDNEAVIDGTENGLRKALKYKRGTSSDIAKILKIMCYGAGLSAININGVCTDNLRENITRSDYLNLAGDDEWLAVYIKNRGWVNVDVYRDCKNVYWGKYEGAASEAGLQQSDNRSYDYCEATTEVFSKDHVPTSYYIYTGSGLPIPCVTIEL